MGYGLRVGLVHAAHLAVWSEGVRTLATKGWENLLKKNKGWETNCLPPHYMSSGAICICSRPESPRARSNGITEESHGLRPHGDFLGLCAHGDGGQKNIIKVTHVVVTWTAKGPLGQNRKSCFRAAIPVHLNQWAPRALPRALGRIAIGVDSMLFVYTPVFIVFVD